MELMIWLFPFIMSYPNPFMAMNIIIFIVITNNTESESQNYVMKLTE
jgi:hypothetical protein